MSFFPVLAWFKASQAMFSIAFVSMVVTLVLAGLYMIFHSLNKNTLILLMIGACFITGMYDMKHLRLSNQKTLPDNLTILIQAAVSSH